MSSDAEGADSPGFSRRGLAAIGLSSVLGTTFASGMIVLARNRHPHILVIGHEKWQALLIEHGSARTVMLLGDFTDSPEPSIGLLCGALRQHVDVLITTSTTLALLGANAQRQRRIRTTVQLDGDLSMGTSTRFIPLTRSLVVSVGDLQLSLARLQSGDWMSSPSTPRRTWIAQLKLGGTYVAIADTLDTIALHGRPDATLGIAPYGDIVALRAMLPGMTVVANAKVINDLDTFLTTDAEMEQSVRVTRTFREDIASFVFRNGVIELPEWSQYLVAND